MTVAKQARRGPPPGASARNIGRSSPLGATVVDGGVNFSLFSRTASGVELLFFDRADDAAPSRVVRIDPDDESHLPLLARVRAAGAAGTDLRLPGRGAVGPRARPAIRPRQGPARSVRPRRGRPGELRPRGRETRGRQRGDRDEERGRRSGRVRLGGRPPAGPALLAHDHLRDARPRIHAPPELRASARRPRGTYRRPDREDPVSPSSSASPPSSCCPVFQFDAQDCPRRAGQLLGLRAGLVLRAAPGLQLASRSARPGG